MMKDDQTGQIVLRDESSEGVTGGHLQLPFTKDAFADFVSSLLGSPQSIERRLSGPYCLDAEDIRQAHLLLEQRVRQQNDGGMLRFSARLEFENDTTVTVSSPESLFSYTSIRKSKTVGILLTWDYMISFPKKQTPEKQTIEISIPGSSSWHGVIDASTGPYFSERPHISITVKYTERTWGEDVLSLLVSHFEGRIGRISRLKRLQMYYSEAAGWIVGVLTYLLVLIGVFRATMALAEKNAEAADRILSSSPESIEYLHTGIEYLIQLQAEGVWAQHFLKMIIIVVVAIPIAILLGSWAERSFHSGRYGFGLPQFLLFPHDSPDARDYYQRYLAGNFRRPLLALVLSFVIGVASNIVSMQLI